MMSHLESASTRSQRIPLLLVLIALLACLASPVLGQGAALKSLEVVFWPEYDRSDVLVMYRAELDPATPIPTQVVLPIPAGVGEPHAVAWRNPQGGLMTAQYTREVVGDQALLTITVPSTAFRVEYYAPMERQEDRRSFTFQWPGGPAIGQLGYEFQTPVGATEVDLSPLPGNQGIGSDGLTYSKGIAGPVAADQSSEMRFTYRKADDSLTAQALAPPPSAMPTPAPTSPPQGAATPIRPPSSSSATQWWPVYVAMALLVGIVAGIALQRRKG